MELFDYERDHAQALRAHLAECTVLLKKDGAFPLKEAGEIALFGSGVRHTVKGGTGSGEVNSRYFITVEQGLTEAGFTITSKEWLDSYDAIRVQAQKDFAKEIKASARAKHTLAIMEGMGAVMPEPEYVLPLDGSGDTAVYVLSRISGEGNDRNVTGGDVKLTETEKRDILALDQKYEKFMLVLNVGGPVDLNDVAEVGNILYLSQLGVETGTVLADVLLGKATPSGKLATTWSVWEDYCGIGEFGDHSETRYKEGVYVGYRYFDAVGKRALYPFGFGLSYTEFETSEVCVAVEGERVTVTARVTNVGGFPGKEVLQVYLSQPDGALDKAYQELAGFAKTAELEPGGCARLSVTFRLSEHTSYDAARGAYVLEQGTYTVRIGTNSADSRPVAQVILDEETVVRNVRSACGEPDFADWKPERTRMEACAEELPHFCVCGRDIPTETVSYERPQVVDDFVRSLSDRELAQLNVGRFSAGGVLNVIGNAASSVAGAAGESSDLLEDRGFPAIVMADGPAGLRLSPRFVRDEKGVRAVGQSAMPESMVEFMPKPVQWLIQSMGKKEKQEERTVEYQYCTAIPIGTALANSWNTEFAELCGDIVGDEMERFGVHFWLAPALNIHRSILCGRNFEYFSEDPRISGWMAAALTRGVQKHPGRGVTIKHYAANNQETNRYSNNSQVSERAMREIYLRGFEICIKEARPKSVMTSYNLLNGAHTSERRDLIEDVLRCEWGFDGLVMTDWIISLMPADKESPYRKPKAHLIAAAGSELVMPGCKKDVQDILAGLKSGALSREQLEVNATRLCRMVRELGL